MTLDEARTQLLDAAQRLSEQPTTAEVHDLCVSAVEYARVRESLRPTGPAKPVRQASGNAPTIPFGRHKGKGIDDPDIPSDYLSWLADSMEGRLDEPGKEQYRKRNEEFIAQLRQEVEARA